MIDYGIFAERCPQGCDEMIPSHWRFCRLCGTEVVKKPRSECRHCGASKFDSRTRWCHMCGMRFPGESPQEDPHGQT